MHAWTDFGHRYPASGPAFVERAPENRLGRLIGHTDFAGHAQQLEDQLLLWEQVGQKNGYPWSR